MTKDVKSATIKLMDERGLIERILKKDKAAVRRFYVDFSPKLLRFINSKVENRADTEEICQDVLYAFLEGARDFSGRSSLLTYLCAIARYKIIDFYRRRKLKKILFSQLPQEIEVLASNLTDPQKLLDNAFLAQKIRSILVKVSPLYRQMIKLKYIEGRSVAEIARILKISFKSAESVLFRARKAFVKLYET